MDVQLYNVKIEAESDAENVRNSDNEVDVQVPCVEPAFVAIKQELPDEFCQSSDPVLPDSTTPDVAVTEYQVTVKQEPLEHVEAVLEDPSTFDYNNVILPEPQPPTVDYDVDSMILNIDGKYQCKLCAKLLTSKYNAQRHIVTHQKTQGHCTLCNLPFLDLQKHLKNDHAIKFSCLQCGKQFNSTSNLHQHEKTHLIIKPFKCSLCTKTFTTRANLVKHEGKSRCKVDECLTCNVCYKEFKYSHLLRSHLTRHTTERPYECHYCSMRFKHKSTIIRHLQLHNTEKQYPCNICGKKFSTPGLIKPHMRMHTGEKPYVCHICNKSFSHKHNMQRHSMLHDKVVHLVCQICHKAFPRESRLKYHMRTHVPDRVIKLPFKCEYCYKRYSHRQNIVRHYKKKHPTKTYTHKETDASIATKIWENMKSKMENKNDFILPDREVKTEIL